MLRAGLAYLKLVSSLRLPPLSSSSSETSLLTTLEAERDPMAEAGRLVAGDDCCDLTAALREVVLPPLRACFLRSLSGIVSTWISCEV